MEKQTRFLFTKGDFKKVDKDGDDHLTEDELKDFYKDDLVALFANYSIGKMLDGKVSQYHATYTKPFNVNQLKLSIHKSIQLQEWLILSVAQNLKILET